MTKTVTDILKQLGEHTLHYSDQDEAYHVLKAALTAHEPEAPRADQWTPEEMARFRMQQAQNMCQGCFRPVSACVCSQMNREGSHG